MSKDDTTKEPADYRDWHKGIDKALNYEENVYGEDSYSTYLWEIEKGILMNEISLMKNRNIKYLDFACGTGRVISFIEPYVAESTGVDVSEAMLDLAKGKVKKSLLLNCDLTVNDIIRDKKYDLITAFRFLLNAQNDLRRQIMPLLAKKLSNDGIIVFNSHGNTLSSHLMPVVLSKLGMRREKLNHLSFFTVFRLIKNSNLKLEKVYGVGFIPTSFYSRFKSLRKLFVNIDNTLSKNGLLKYFAKNLIFVCCKRQPKF